jgi:hypothetical protein
MIRAVHLQLAQKVAGSAGAGTQTNNNKAVAASGAANTGKRKSASTANALTESAPSDKDKSVAAIVTEPSEDTTLISSEKTAKGSTPSHNAKSNATKIPSTTNKTATNSSAEKPANKTKAKAAKAPPPKAKAASSTTNKSPASSSKTPVKKVAGNKRSASSRSPSSSSSSSATKKNNNNNNNNPPSSRKRGRFQTLENSPHTSIPVDTPNEDIGFSWPLGWKRRVVMRQDGLNKTRDKYWYTPQKGFLLRSIKQVKLFLETLEKHGGDEEATLIAMGGAK